MPFFHEIPTVLANDTFRLSAFYVLENSCAALLCRMLMSCLQVNPWRWPPRTNHGRSHATAQIAWVTCRPLYRRQCTHCANENEKLFRVFANPSVYLPVTPNLGAQSCSRVCVLACFATPINLLLCGASCSFDGLWPNRDMCPGCTRRTTPSSMFRRGRSVGVLACAFCLPRSTR